MKKQLTLHPYNSFEVYGFLHLIQLNKRHKTFHWF
jgi:hypothetical protein